jgi:hypothetical protein
MKMCVDYQGIVANDVFKGVFKDVTVFANAAVISIVIIIIIINNRVVEDEWRKDYR